MKITAIIDGKRTDLEVEDHLSPTEAAEVAFCRLNHGSGMEEPGYRGRSLSVGDMVEVGPYLLKCAGAGWEVLRS